MELPDLGKHCSVPDCKQLDFLPIGCSCNLIFCREHFAQHTELCPNRKVPEKIQTETTTYVCSHPECGEKSIVPLICEKCQRHYCVSHRHFDCEVDLKKVQEAKDLCNQLKIQSEIVQVAVNAEIERNLSNAKRKQKNLNTANKVQLMRLKGKAKGQNSIPTADRVYFLVHNKCFPVGVPVFVSRDWSVGKVIDAIASECKLENNNNKVGSPKLRLFRKSDGQILTDCMSDKMKGFLDGGVIVNGESLNLDYGDL